MTRELKRGIYRHFKGNYYYLYETATHTETGEIEVVYRALYGERKLWVRPIPMWTEILERGGKSYPRFTYIGDVDSDDPTIQELVKKLKV